MSTKDVAGVLVALLGIAMIVCSFGLASDFAGRDDTQRQMDCINKGGSYVAIYVHKGKDNEFTDGYECLMKER